MGYFEGWNKQKHSTIRRDIGTNFNHAALTAPETVVVQIKIMKNIYIYIYTFLIVKIN